MFSILFKLALRNLVRNFRRTLLTVGSISFGLAVIFWLLSILEGRQESLVRNVISTHTGHLQLFRSDFLKGRLTQDTLEDAPSEILDLLPPGSHWSRRTHLPVLLSIGKRGAPATLLGVEPDREAKITRLESSLLSGKYLKPDPTLSCDSRQIYIGKELAERLQAQVGDPLTLMARTKDGELKTTFFLISGIFNTGSPEFDAGFAYTPLTCANRIAAITGFHELVIKLPSNQDTSRIRSSANQSLPSHLTLHSWREASPRLNSVLVYNEACLVMVSILLFVVMIMGVMNTIFMSVVERSREIGMMMALGLPPQRVRTLLYLESSLIGIIGSCIGTLMGSAAILYHHYRGFDLTPLLGNTSGIDQFHLDLILYPRLNFWPFLKYLGMANVLIGAASLAPAYRASRQNVMDAVRNS